MRNPKLIAALLALLLLCGCAPKAPAAEIAATTGPVAQFTMAVTEGTGLTVTQVVTDSVSCLHDYSLSIGQMEAIAGSRVTVISGGGLEEAMEDALSNADTVIDCSGAVDAGNDPHFWLSPGKAAAMVTAIRDGLTAVYPEYGTQFDANAAAYIEKLEALQAYGEETLADLSCRKLITFHDGFGWLAAAFDLEILAAIEEESGSEVSAHTLTEIIGLVNDHGLPAVFTETNGSDAAASVIQSETGVKIYALDMAMGGSDYLQAMYANIDTLKEALQ